MITANRYHDFCAGHRVYGHESKCAHLHGHNYRAVFYCSADELDTVGRVIDFSVIKDVLCEWLESNWDHRMLLWEQDPFFESISAVDEKAISVPFNPTAENMADYLVNTIAPQLLDGSGVRLDRCELWETRKCFVTVSK